MRGMSELTESFAKNGYIYCREMLADAVEPILAELARIIRDELDRLPTDHVFFEDKADPATLKQIQQLQTHSDFFRVLAEEGELRDLSATLLGERTDCQNVQYFNKPPQIGKPTPPHQDGYYFCLSPPSAVTMWIALDTVDEENGCVRYIPKSHLQAVRSHGPTDTLGFSQGISDFPTPADTAAEIAILASPGDVLAHHALTIHRADGNNSPTRTRRALGIIYYGESAKEDAGARERYLQQLQRNQSGKI